MSERRPSFRQRDIVAAIKAANETGIAAAGVEIHLDGSLRVIGREELPPPPAPKPVSAPPPIPFPSEPAVYFLAAPPIKPIKIGYSGYAFGRIAELQTGCPYRLHAVAFAPGPRDLEGEVHRHFRADQLEGEWFERTDELMSLIRALRRGENIYDLLLGIRRSRKGAADA